MADTLLLHNARIRTMDPANPWAAWLLMAGGRVLALGLSASQNATIPETKFGLFRM